MKRLILAFQIISLLFVAGACKKGEDDPFFTLLSRKARITGTWELKEGDWSVKHRKASEIDSVYSFRAGKLTLTVNNVELPAFDQSRTFEMNGQGDYKIFTVQDYPANFNGSVTPEFSIETTRNGFWQFGSGNGEVPSKSELVLKQALYQQTYAIGANVDVIDVENPREAFVYSIKRLTNKELVLTYDEVYSDRFGRELREGTLTYEKVDGQTNI